jgi:hypothetical protein
MDYHSKWDQAQTDLAVAERALEEAIKGEISNEAIYPGSAGAWRSRSTPMESGIIRSVRGVGENKISPGRMPFCMAD